MAHVRVRPNTLYARTTHMQACHIRAHVCGYHNTCVRVTRCVHCSVTALVISLYRYCGRLAYPGDRSTCLCWTVETWPQCMWQHISPVEVRPLNEQHLVDFYLYYSACKHHVVTDIDYTSWRHNTTRTPTTHVPSHMCTRTLHGCLEPRFNFGSKKNN